MSLSDMFKKKEDVKQSISSEHTPSGNPTVSLTKNVELNKRIDLRKRTIAVELEKSKITLREARIVFILDHSSASRRKYAAI